MTRLLSGLLLVMLLLLEAAAQPYGLTQRPPVGTYFNGRFPSAPPGNRNWKLVPAYPNLTFEDPTVVVPVPRMNRVVVCGRQGVAWILDDVPTATARTVFLDVRSRNQGWESSGLLGLAFHPEFGLAGSPNRGFVYVYYHYSDQPTQGPDRPEPDRPGYNRLSRFTVPDGQLTVNPASELVLVNQYDRHLWHNGGSIFFGPDGFLYFCNGDEGGANDEFNASQKLTGGLFGGVFRIDVNRDASKSHPIRRQPRNENPSSPASSTGNYFIPNDNPFQDPGGGLLEEYYALGLRSPHRMTLDSVSGRIWLGDVGQDTWEELNLIVRGGNYQWPYREGPVLGPKSKPSPLTGSDQNPVYSYLHAEGNNAVIGGYVYRGTEHASDLGGAYLFGDNGSGRLWSLRYENGQIQSLEYLATVPGHNYTGLSGFGLDSRNELLICQMGPQGVIWKLAKGSPTPNPYPPALLSATSLFPDMAQLRPAPELLPYAVNTPFWSDGAEKRRWIAVPNNGSPYDLGERVLFSPTGEWAFPQGTVFVKHFDLVVDETTGQRRRLETRVLVQHQEGGVYGFTYKWRNTQTEADLVTNSVQEAISVKTASGVRTQNWFYPGPADCLTCHNSNAGHVLGVKTHQLNGTFTYPQTGITDNQLRTWNHLQLFSPTLEEAAIPGMLKSVPIHQTSASLEARVRSYLAANCAQCHRPNGGQSFWDARFETPLTSQGIVNGKVANSLGIADARVVAPQDLVRSILHHRMNTTGSAQMPPLGRQVVDQEAVRVIEQWIASLPKPEPIPAPWADRDIGNTGLAGEVQYAGGVFTVIGAGADIWGGSDAFHFLHQPLQGDGAIVARVRSIQPTHAWAKAGLMIRESLDPTARNALVMLTPSHGIGLQWRSTPSGASSYLAGPAATAPVWLKLERVGTRIQAFTSPQGTQWTLVGTLQLDLPATVWIGLAVTSHDAGTRNASEFDSVSTTGSPPPGELPAPANLTATAGSSSIGLAWSDRSSDEEGFEIERSTDGTTFVLRAQAAANATAFTDASVQPGIRYHYRVRALRGTARSAYSNVADAMIASGGGLPAPWQTLDVGVAAAPGSAASTATGFELRSQSQDIWNQADHFRFVYQEWRGDGEWIARVESLTQTDPWAKAGLMIRENTTSGSRNVLVMATASQGTGMQWRSAAGGASDYRRGWAHPVPAWLRLVRQGSTFTAYSSVNGTDWVLIGTQSLSLPETVLAGLALTSHNTSQMATARFGSVQFLGGGTPPTAPPSAPTQLTAEALSSSEIRLRWSDQSTNEQGFAIEASADGVSFLEIARTGAGAVEYRETGLGPGQTRHYRVRAFNGSGFSPYSNTASARTLESGGLPAPWQNLDIGSVALAGSATWSTGRFTVSASGSDIWNSADSFHFVFQPWNGDGEWTARVESLERTDPWAKAGIMIRENLSPGSRHAMTFFTPDQGTGFQMRTTAGGGCTYTAGPRLTGSAWIRLARRGGVVEAAVSPDGATWTAIGTFNWSGPAGMYVGLAVTSHNQGALTRAQISQVQMR